MNKQISLSIIAALLLLGEVHSRPIEAKVEITFDLNECAVERTTEKNDANLRDLNGLMRQLETDPHLTITSITVESYASPEGDSYSNQKLTARRSQSIYRYLRDELSVADSLITLNTCGVAWDQLREMVSASEMEGRDEVVAIIDNVPEERWRRINPTDRWQTLVDSRNKHLMDLRGGRPYRYMQQAFFPELRSSSIVTIYCQEQVAEPTTDSNIEFEIRELQLAAVEEVEPQPQPQPQQIAEAEPTTSEPQPTTSNPEPTENNKTPIKFALKTNLLYDLLLTPNIEVEIPVKNHWSVTGEWIFPWWVTKDNGNALQILSGQLEGKYWFGDRTGKPQLTGWFAGLYAGGGLYDLQWKNNGYQGEFYIAAGVSGGYAHTINRRGNLRMEYSVGAGYLSTEYRYYEGMEDNKYLVWQHDGKYTWIGATKAKASLVWMLNVNKRGGDK